MEQDHRMDMRGAPIGRDDFKRIRDMGLSAESLPMLERPASG